MRTHTVTAFLVVGTLSLAACANDSPPSNGAVTLSDATATDPEERHLALGGFSNGRVGKFRLRRAMKTLKRLSAGIGVRERATAGEQEAAQYVARKFRRLGYKVHIQKFSVDGGTSRNVVARWPGQIDHPFIIGGHMDSVPGSPGANDNASGVAAILEAARLSAGKRPAKYIRWIAFGSEEYGDDGRHHVGSEVYVQSRSRRERKKMPGMISVDMISDGKPLLTGSFGIGPRVLGRMVYRRITQNSRIALRYETLCDCSDNGPFEHAGIPGAYMYSGNEPDYHSPSDTPPNMRPKHLKRTGRALMVFIRRLDAQTLRYLRRF